jgi:hypothetical protein
MNLIQAHQGASYLWKSYRNDTPEEVKEIFRDYGILPGSEITIESNRHHSKIIIRWEGTILGLDHHLANFVEVETIA